MVDRVCISINNHCNLNCEYCHFHEKSLVAPSDDMDVIRILDNIIEYIEENNIPLFKIGFVGNGEPLLDYDRLTEYILYLDEYIKAKRISIYTITNGTLVTREMLEFFKIHDVRLGFSIDGLKEIHNKFRCGSFDMVMSAIRLYHDVNGEYPPLNCTVGRAILEKSDETIAFFQQFSSKVTFSRMIGKMGVSLQEFNAFLDKAEVILSVRRGKYDCTMYGGKCGAGINNYFFANGNVYLCGNCIDLPSIGSSDMKISEIKPEHIEFDRTHCYKETICE